MPTESRLRVFVWKNLLSMLTMLGVFIGGLTGYLIKTYTGEWTKREIMYVSFPGELFLRLLKCLIVPLLVCSITSAIGGLNLNMAGRVAYRALIYYFFTTMSAVFLGIFLVTTIRPGDRVVIVEKSVASVEKASKTLTPDTLMDLVRNMFTDNIVQATMFQYRTELFENTSASPPLPMDQWSFKPSIREGSNVLGLVVFSVVLGATIALMREKGQLLLDFFNVLTDAMMIITSWVIWISPIGVGCLIAAKMIEMDSLSSTFQSLGWYFLTVMIGLFLHGYGTLPLLFFLATRRFPYGYVIKMGQALVTAFGTGSSSATMPLTIKCLDNMGIDSRVTHFVIPVGTTINMDGTALYEAVAALFIAQYRKKSYSYGTILAVSIAATAASIGAAGIPQAGLITMVMVLDTVGLDPRDVSLILAVDWLLDRFRTSINVMGDAFGTIIVEHLSRKDLQAIDAMDGPDAEAGGAREKK